MRFLIIATLHIYFERRLQVCYLNVERVKAQIFLGWYLKLVFLSKGNTKVWVA